MKMKIYKDLTLNQWHAALWVNQQNEAVTDEGS